MREKVFRATFLGASLIATGGWIWLLLWITEKI
jgi:hypothetical protein